jgi:nucleoside-diphosphate-sugar epimerase
VKVLIIGATGYIGSAIAELLNAQGHQVLGSARSDEAAQKLRTAGVEPISADVENAASLASGAHEAGAVVYAVQYAGRYSGEDGGAFPEIEKEALGALVDALAETKKTLIYTSGTWVYGNTGGRAVDESSPVNPIPLVARRPELEQTVLAGASRGVRAIVLRPGCVYGRGRGLPAMWVQSARESGSARFVGDGTNHWPVVHVEDLARAYALALEKANPGDLYNVADETSFTVREMAQAASFGAGKSGLVTPWPLEDARKALGPFADALALDSRVSSRKIRTSLGWTTRTPTILNDLRTGSYTAAAAR